MAFICIYGCMVIAGAACKVRLQPRRPDSACHQQHVQVHPEGPKAGGRWAINQRLYYDAAFAMAAALARNRPVNRIREDERGDAFDEFYRVAHAGLEAFCIQDERMRQRLKAAVLSPGATGIINIFGGRNVLLPTNPASTWAQKS